MTKPNYPNVQNVSDEDDLKWKMTSNGRLPKIPKNSNISATTGPIFPKF